MRRFVGILILVLLLCSCSSKKEEAKVAAQAARGETRGLAALLPRDEDVGNWKRITAPRFFQPDNLYEYIDGAAEGYLAYGFREVVTADYSLDGSEEQQITVDIYEMKDRTNAFGIYSAERSSEYGFLQMGTEGYLGETNLNFWKDRYYVKLLAFEPSQKVSDGMRTIGRPISEKIPGEAEAPRFLDYLPETGYVAHSATYISKDVLGQSFLSKGYMADYKIGGQEGKLFLIDASDEQETRKGFDRYRAFVAQSGKPISDLGDIGEAGFTGEESFYGRAVIFRKGKVMGGVLGLPRETGIALIREALAKMGE